MATPHSNPGSAFARQSGHANDRGLQYAWFPVSENTDLTEHVTDTTVSPTGANASYTNDSSLGLFLSRTSADDTHWLFTDAALGLVAALNAGDDWTVVSRIRQDGALTGGTYGACLTDNQAGGLRDFDICWHYSTTDTRVILNDNGTRRDYNTLSIPYSQDTWFTLVITFDHSAGEVSFFVNGAFVIAVSAAWTNLVRVASDWQIFAGMNNFNSSKCSFSYLAFHDVELSDTEIANYSDDVFAGWRVSEGSAPLDLTISRDRNRALCYNRCRRL
jgi:hypothetical protein